MIFQDVIKYFGVNLAVHDLRKVKVNHYVVNLRFVDSVCVSVYVTHLYMLGCV